MAADSSHMNSVRAAYEALAQNMAMSASRAYVRALTEHQDAALAGDPDASRVIREAHALLAQAAPPVGRAAVHRPRRPAGVLPPVHRLKEHT